MMQLVSPASQVSPTTKGRILGQATPPGCITVPYIRNRSPGCVPAGVSVNPATSTTCCRPLPCKQVPSSGGWTSPPAKPCLTVGVVCYSHRCCTAETDVSTELSSGKSLRPGGIITNRPGAAQRSPAHGSAQHAHQPVRLME
jgi:hypothetical protein